MLAVEPVFAWLTSFVMLGERLGLRPAVGALAILAGILVTELGTPATVATGHEG